jgi:hypothetical protein
MISHSNVSCVCYRIRYGDLRSPPNLAGAPQVFTDKIVATSATVALNDIYHAFLIFQSYICNVINLFTQKRKWMGWYFVLICVVFLIVFRAPCKFHLNMLRQSCCKLATTERVSLFGVLHMCDSFTAVFILITLKPCRQSEIVVFWGFTGQSDVARSTHEFFITIKAHWEPARKTTQSHSLTQIKLLQIISDLTIHHRFYLSAITLPFIHSQ